MQKVKDYDQTMLAFNKTYDALRVHDVMLVCVFFIITIISVPQYLLKQQHHTLSHFKMIIVSGLQSVNMFEREQTLQIVPSQSTRKRATATNSLCPSEITACSHCVRIPDPQTRAFSTSISRQT